MKTLTYSTRSAILLLAVSLFFSAFVAGQAVPIHGHLTPRRQAKRLPV